MSHHTNLVRIKGVYHALGGLKDTVAFVGGATVSLYTDRPDQADVRPTDDIDVLVEIGTYGEYSKIQAQLSELNFHPDSESSVICRYKYQGLIVDIMPTDESILGFSNKWYKEGFANLQKYRIDERTEVNIFSAPYFIASKIEAFKGRGQKDGRLSQDFEDIVFVLDNRKDIWNKFKASANILQDYLKAEFSELLGNPFIDEWLSAHLEHGTATARAKMIIDSMKDFVS
jgi:predicted nucleotidyltransferase